MKHLNPRGSLWIDHQATYLIQLKAKLYSLELEKSTHDHLSERSAKDEKSVSEGIIIKAVCTSLGLLDCNLVRFDDKIYKFFTVGASCESEGTQRKFPSWGALFLNHRSQLIDSEIRLFVLARTTGPAT